MRGLMIGCAVALVLVGANTVMAADVSHQTLATMGISGMETMSDAQGMEVRGKGFVMVWGSGTAFAAPGTYYSTGFVGVSMRPNAKTDVWAKSVASGAFNTNWSFGRGAGWAR